MLRLQMIPKKDYVAKRYSAGGYVNGVYVKSVSTDIPFKATIEPLKPYQVMQLPEADRTLSWVRVYTDAPLRSKKEGTGGYAGDTFVYNGETYEVRKLDKWDVGILDHNKIYAVRVSLVS